VAHKAYAQGNYDFAMAFNNRGRAYADKGDYDRAIELDGDYAFAFNNRGLAHLHKGQFDRAIADFDRAIRLKPDFAKAFNNRGRAYRKKDQYDRAIADYDQAINSGDLSNANLASIFKNRGNTYADKDEYDRAIADYDRATRLKPDDGEVFYIRGVSYGRKGDYDRAIADYDRAIGLGSPSDHDLARVLVNRGLAYNNKGDYDRAIADYDRAIELDPDDALAFNNKAWVLATASHAQARDGREAVRLARQAVSLDDDPGYRDTLAAAYAEAGRFDDAVAEQVRAIEMLRAAGWQNEIADSRSRLGLYRRGQPYRE
jgi:tetratricopeptide (TPR) repeat protein